MVEGSCGAQAITVVIPCHGGVADTRAAIATLQAQRDAPPLTILVVDNGSQDGTRDLAGEFRGVRVLRLEENLGFAGGVNRGLAVATTPLVLVLNNDTLAAPHLVARLAATLASDARIGLVAPISNHVKGPARVAFGDLGATEAGRLEIEAALAQGCAGRSEDVETLSGLCLLFRRELLAEIGGFDEVFGLGNFEDDDFCLRVRKRGHRLVIVRDAYLHHHGHRTFAALGVDYRATIEARRETFRAKWADDAVGAAVLARMDGDWSRAEAATVTALAATPSWPDGHFVLGRVAAARGEAAAARRHLGTFLASCPRHGEATVLLALQEMALGESEPTLVTQGLERLRRAFSELWLSDELAVSALSHLARWCLAHARAPEAVEHARDALALRSADGGLHNLLGVALLESGAPVEAEHAFAKAHELANPDAQKNLGVCYWRQGRPAPALAAMVAAVRANPSDREALNNLALARRALGI